MYQKLLAVSLVAVGLGACGEGGKKEAQQELACNDPAVVQTLRQNIETVVKQQARTFARNDSRQFVDADKVIAAASDLEISLDGAHTVQEGSKSLCSAELKIRIPNETMNIASGNSPLIYGEANLKDLIEQRIMGSHLKFADNLFSTTLRYTPSQTDGVLLEDNILTTTAQMVSTALLPYGVKSIVMIDGKPVSKEDALKMGTAPEAEPPVVKPEDILENNAASQFEGVPQAPVGLDTQPEMLNPTDEARPKTPALSFSDLEAAREQNRQADREIKNIWNGMDSTVQQGMLAEQRTWVQNKSSNCAQAAAQADDEAQAEYLKLQCDTRMTRERTQYLRGYTIN